MPQLISFISEPECQNTGENLNQDCLWLQDEVFENLTFSMSYEKSLVKDRAIISCFSIGSSL